MILKLIIALSRSRNSVRIFGKVIQFHFSHHMHASVVWYTFTYVSLSHRVHEEGYSSSIIYECLLQRG